MAFKMPPLPTTRELIRLFGLSAKKQLSQNFLLDLNVTDKMVRKSGNLRKATVIEVGPGPGGLTRSILNAGAKQLTVVEKDRRFIPALQTIQQALPEGRLTIHNDDIMAVSEEEIFRTAGTEKVAWEDDVENAKIIGNLPFGIATELLLKWIRDIPERKGPFAFGRVPMVLLFQKEVAMRICAPVGTKSYSRLSVMTQHLCETKSLFDIDGASFVPPPKVTATAVWIRPLVTPIAHVNTADLELVCRQVFGQRRKVLSNSIKTIGPGAEVLIDMSGLPATVRPEDLTIPQWCDLATAYRQWFDSFTPEQKEGYKKFNMTQSHLSKKAAARL